MTLTEVGIESSVPSSSVTMLPRTDLIVPSTLWPILLDFCSIFGWAGSVFIWADNPVTPIEAVRSTATPTASTRIMCILLRVGFSPTSSKPSATSTHRRLGIVQRGAGGASTRARSEEHTSELQSRLHLVCRLLL